MLLESGPLQAYLDNTTDEENSLLKLIDRETHLKETMPHMASGHYQGRALSMFSKLIQPNLALEIGTFTGYATLCLAEGLTQKGVLHTIDINEEQRERVQGYFDQSAFARQIHYHIGDAADLLPQIGGVFDLVFIDADKKRNLYYFNEVIDRVRPGGLVLVDNVLWKGKIFDDSPDKQAQRVIDVNKILTEDQRVEKLILPIRDGLFVLRRK